MSSNATEESKSSFWHFFSLDEGIKRFRSAIQRKDVSSFLLVLSVSLMGLFLILSNLPALSFFKENFVEADLYKINLFTGGQSPYSTDVWAASYPPLYYIIWSAPYTVLKSLLVFLGLPNSFEEIYAGLQAISAGVMCSCAYLIYKGLLRNHSKEESVSLASIFLMCSLSAVISLVGDSFGLFFLVLGCLFFIFKKELLGISLISLAVAFKVHPVFGAFLFLVYLLTLSKTRFVKAAIVSMVVFTAFLILPALELPGAFNAIVVMRETRLQAYTFNLYAGLLDTFADLVPPSLASAASIQILLDGVWFACEAAVLAFFTYFIIKKRSIFRWAHPVEIVALGLLLWMFLLKQTLPHYFLWALVPLAVLGRIKSLVYLITGEVTGLIFFGLGFFFSPSPVVYTVIPGLSASLSFLIGGILFAFFDLMAIRSLLSDIRAKAVQTSRSSGSTSLQV